MGFRVNLRSSIGYPVYAGRRTLWIISTSILRPMSALHTAYPDPHESRRQALVDAFTQGPEAAVTDARVIDSMRRTPRHLFVPEDQREFAYEDRPLPIGHGQTISQPSLVAFMTEQLHTALGDRVLEIGTGSGYQAAVLAPLVREIYSVEIVKPLAEQAARTLHALGLENIHTRLGDGSLGWPEAAPFDAIIVTCAPDAIPEALVRQLREGGRMMIPAGPRNEVQQLWLLEKREGAIQRRSMMPVRFVPMTGDQD